MRNRAAFIIVFASLVITSLPTLVRLTRRACELLPLSYAERRARVNGELYTGAMRMNRSVPMSEPLALVTGDDPDPALFVNYYVYPRRTRIYRGIVGYRNAANERERPGTIVSVGDTIRFATYEQLRDEQLRGKRVMHGPLEAAPRQFMLPLVGSLDGPVTDSYVTEADFENGGDARATLRMTLFPQRATKTISIAPHSTTSYYDLVYQNFLRMEAGWMRIECDQPLRAAVWLVNRARDEGVRIPLVIAPRSGTIHCPGNDCLLWLVNLGDEPTVANVNGSGIVVGAESVITQPLHDEAIVSGENIYAFAGTRGGKTVIAWP